MHPACFLVGLSSVLVDSIASSCTSTLLNIIFVVAHNLDSVLHILIFQQVSVVLCSASENKPYDISSPSTADVVFRQMRMLGKHFKQM